MASLALAAAVIVLFTVLVGPVTYLLARLGFPKIIIYILSLLCFFTGIHLCLLAIPIWYLGLIPIYFGYISIARVNKKETQA
jgi:hypothetical protein